MPTVLPEKDLYLSSFDQFERAAGDSPSWLQRLREDAITRFNELGFPTARNEDWKFTSVAPLVQVPFQLAESAGPVDMESLRPHLFTPAFRLVFVNGRHVPERSEVKGLPAGVTVQSLAAALRERPEQVREHLGRHARYDNAAFTALNTAFIRDGAYISVAKGVVLDRPIHLVFVAAPGADATVAHARNLVLAGRNSQFTLVETYFGPEGEVYFTSAVTEVATGENAVIDHYKVQRESKKAFHIATLQTRQERTSNFSSHYVGLGGGLVRNESRVLFAGEGGEATVNGLYLAGGRQHLDNHTVIDHAQPHCASHELYKGILDGQAHGVFNGKIFVRQDAQKTDAKQTNQTLLLSEDAVIDTKPQLEIFADDVKCTHGATVGQIDAEALFYLRSRGIGHEEARSLLTYAFANDILGRIKVEPVRAQLEEDLLAARHLPRFQETKETV